MENMEALRELWETACHEVSSANNKIMAAGGRITAGDIDYLDKLTHMIKSIKTTLAMPDSEQGGSHRGYEGAHRGSYEDDSSRYAYDSMEYEEGSNARGRGRGARRDSMGRYM